MIVEHNQSSFYDNAYKFNGKELDEATGMYYYGARYYDPRISIFVSVDPLAEQTMEPYSYVGNNPIMFIDPTGMNADPIYGTNWLGQIKFIGDDGKDDGKIHLVTNNKQARSITKQTNSGNTSIDLTNVDKVTLHGGDETVNGVIASVDAESKDTSPGAGDARLHEEGGHTEIDSDGNVTAVFWKPGDKKTGTKNASITPFNGVRKPSTNELADYWHTHTSGAITNIDPRTGESFITYAALGPSGKNGDIGYQNRLEQDGYNTTAIQIDTRGSKRVNFYTGSGNVTSIKYSAFKKLKYR